MCDMTPYRRNGFKVEYDRHAEIEHVVVHLYSRKERINIGVKFYVEDGVAYFASFVDAEIPDRMKHDLLVDAFDAVTEVHGVEELPEGQTQNVAKLA